MYFKYKSSTNSNDIDNTYCILIPKSISILNILAIPFVYCFLKYLKNEILNENCDCKLDIYSIFD